MGPEQYDKLLSFMREHFQTSTVVVNGGEPFTRPDIFEILDIITRRRMATYIYTNASLIDRKKAEKLADYPILGAYVSLHSLRREFYEELTSVPKALDQILRGVENLVGVGIPVTLQMTLMCLPHSGCNTEEVLRIAELVKERELGLNVEHIIYPLIKGGYPPVKPPPDEEVVRALRESESVGKMRGEEIPLKIKVESSFDNFICNAGIATSAVDPYGKIYPCYAFLETDAVMGHVDDDLGEVYSENNPVLRKIRSVSYPCFSCPLSRYCRRCLGEVYRAGGCAGHLKRGAEIDAKYSGTIHV